MTSKVNVHLKPLKILNFNFITKIGHIDYVKGGGATRTPNFMGIGLGVSAPQIAKI